MLPACTSSPSSNTASIGKPGPDLANYPNSAYTLTQGQAYIEAIPAAFYGDALNSPQQFNASYLLRYGLTDTFELRLFSTGYILQDAKPKDKSGFGPQVFDVKWHLIDDAPGSFMPAIGIEASVQTTWGSEAFKSNTQSVFSLNFDKAFSHEIAAEFNIGFIGVEDIQGETIYQLDVAWAVQRNIAENVALFIDGYVNTISGLTSSAIGGGTQWTVNERLAIFTKIDAGLTTATPSLNYLLGFAVAF